jgi:diguanylate cyclase (GGDEF)-like protein/PAS domain S-box-containing protein
MEDYANKTKEELVEALTESLRTIDNLKTEESQNQKIEEIVCRFAEANYSAVFNAANDAILVHDIETLRIVDANDKACEMFCYHKSEILDLNMNDLSADEEPYKKEALMLHARKATDGEAQLFDWIGRDKAGRAFWMEINLKRAVIGGKYRLLAVARDITERKRTEERLKKINETFLHFGPDPTENINHLTALCGTLMEADCALYNRLEGGLLYSCGQWNVPENFNPVDNPEGHICYDVIKNDSGDMVVIRNLQDTEYARTDPNVAQYKLETYIGYAVRFGAQCVGVLCAVYKYDFVPADEDKEIMGIIASAIGIEEERKSVEDVSHLSHFSIEHAADSIFWIGPDAKILYVNDKTCEALGYSKEELCAMTVHDIDPNFPKSVWASRWKELKEKKSFTFESKEKRKDGSVFPVEITVNYLEFQGSEYNFVFVRDIIERKKQEESLLRRDEQLEILSRTSQHLNAVLEIQIILRTLVAGAMELVGATGGMAGILTGVKMKFTEYNKNGKLVPIEYMLDMKKGVTAHITKTMKPYISNDAEHDERVLPEKQRAFGLYSLVSVPIINRKGEAIGCFEIHNKESHQHFDAQDIFMLQGLAASAAVALENARMLRESKHSEGEREKLNRELLGSNKKLKQFALKDSQTGLYNHRYLSEFIEPELYRAIRYGHPLSVIMIDIDYFKSINDVYGHKFGDMVIVQFAKLLRRLVRRYDIVVRFGGEEFVIICPGVNRPRSMMLGQRILDSIGMYKFGGNRQVVRLKVSIAVASFPDDKVTKGIDLINLADLVLNKVKEAGGSRVFSSDDVGIRKGMSHEEVVETTDVRALKEKIEKLTKKGKQSLIESIFAFAKTIELRDHYTGEHGESTVHYATGTAKEMQLPMQEIENIREAAVLHDLGKIGISDKILHKRSKLTKKEFDEIKKHPQIAADIIRPIQFMHDIVPLVLYHHERWDGKGYPAGLKKEEIPIGARVIAIADVYQALTSDRPYRKAYHKKEAVDIVKGGSGTQFDPAVVSAFMKLVKKEKSDNSGGTHRRK